MPHMKLIVPKKLSKKAYKKAVAEVSAEWDKRLAVLNEPSAAGRVDAMMDAQARSKKRPKAGETF